MNSEQKFVFVSVFQVKFTLFRKQFKEILSKFILNYAYIRQLIQKFLRLYSNKGFRFKIQISLYISFLVFRQIEHKIMIQYIRLSIRKAFPKSSSIITSGLSLNHQLNITIFQRSSSLTPIIHNSYSFFLVFYGQKFRYRVVITRNFILFIIFGFILFFLGFEEGSIKSKETITICLEIFVIL